MKNAPKPMILKWDRAMLWLYGDLSRGVGMTPEKWQQIDKLFESAL